jgi:ABC-type Fe3+/spermidine/putrescine transport system ATPase subunit
MIVIVNQVDWVEQGNGRIAVLKLHSIASFLTLTVEHRISSFGKIHQTCKWGKKVELELRNVSKFYGKFQAVKSVSFSVEKGELFSIVGPSGCGKTTMLRMIAGFVVPDEGQIILNGSEVTYAPINKRSTAMVFQNYALFPHMSIFDNIAFGLRMHKVPLPEIRKRVGESLELIHLPGIEAKYPNQLSGGEQQRVALARALVIQPQVLLLDEPLSNLDAKMREKLRMEIREIQQKVGITTLFVTHDISEAFMMSNRIAVANTGQIVQVGDPMTLYDYPTAEFVGAFVGKYNSFTARVKVVEGSMAKAVVDSNLCITFDNSRSQFKEQQDVRLMVRPERVRLTVQQSGCHNSLPGVVQRVFYLGSQIYYEVDASGTMVMIEKQNDSEQRYRESDRVFVEWGDYDSVCFV